MENENEMKEKLIAAGKKAEAVEKKRKEKVIPGAHLLDKMKALLGMEGLTANEKGDFFQVTGKPNKRKLYLAVKGGRVALSGYTVQADGVIQLTAEEAAARHLGRVRGELDFSKDDTTVMGAFTSALGALLEDAPAPEPKPATEKKPRQPRAKKAKPAETPSTEAVVTPDGDPPTEAPAPVEATPEVASEAPASTEGENQAQG